MAMDLNAKAAYIRGLMTGMEFDPNSKNGKIIAAMMDLLEEMADTVTEHDNALDQVYDELEVLDEDMDDLVDALYGEEEDEDDGEEAEYEVTCPNCGTVTTVDEDTLLNKQLVCPSCGAAFDIEFESCDGNCAACTAEDVDCDQKND
ncbi:MAG: CD1247 N-terminal domain-containing protein [Gemmiger sp.]